MIFAKFTCLCWKITYKPMEPAIAADHDHCAQVRSWRSWSIFINHITVTSRATIASMCRNTYVGSFQSLVSYLRFVEFTSLVLIPFCAYLRSRCFGQCTGLSHRFNAHCCVSQLANQSTRSFPNSPSKVRVLSAGSLASNCTWFPMIKANCSTWLSPRQHWWSQTSSQTGKDLFGKLLATTAMSPNRSLNSCSTP